MFSFRTSFTQKQFTEKISLSYAKKEDYGIEKIKYDKSIK